MVVTLPGSQAGPWDPVGVGNHVLFRYGDVEHGVELWRSDLTPEGTTIVCDINPNR